MTDFKDIWETYSSAWKAETEVQKRAILADTLATQAVYTDPTGVRTGYDELIGYMTEFHKQIPGGHFVVTYFLAHHGKSIAKWNMMAGDGSKIGVGVSYGEYNADNKLVAITGFFDT